MMIVPLTAEHLDRVAEIEASDGAAHWSRAQFEKELESEGQRFFVVVESEGSDPLAYGGYWKAGPEAQITNIVVRQDSQCLGIGRRLLEFLFDCARGELCTVCTLEVRESNKHAQSLYQSVGFEVKGKRAKLYGES